MIEKPCPGLGHLRRNLGEPDRGLHRLNLTKDAPDLPELVMPPMLQKPLCAGRDFPVAGILQAAPLIDEIAEFIDNR
jgi:hypothetical protein